jgi:DNA-binding GntR family transcriptional regulator
VVQLPLLYKAYLWYDDQALQASAQDHRALLEMLRTQNGDAAEPHWRTHLLRGRDVLVEHLAEAEAGEA